MTVHSHRVILVLGLILCIILGGLGLERYLTTIPSRPFGHTRGAHIVGWVAFLLLSLVLVYPYKRWRHPEGVWPKHWFRVHTFCGVGGAALIFVHAGDHFHALVPVGAVVALLLVVMTGLIGQMVHYNLFRSLSSQRQELAAQGMSEEAIESHLHNLVLDEAAFRWWKCFHGPLTWTFVVLTVLHIGGAMYWGGLS